jgi:hypothetical protein
VATTALIFRFFAFSFRLAGSGLYLLAACGLKLAAFAFSFRLAAYQLTATLRRLYSIFKFSHFQIFKFASLQHSTFDIQYFLHCITANKCIPFSNFQIFKFSHLHFHISPPSSTLTKDLAGASSQILRKFFANLRRSLRETPKHSKRICEEIPAFYIKLQITS